MAAGAAPDPAPVAASETIVGRDRELATLRDALAAALAERGSLVLLGGEAGIGKTTLAEVLTSEAVQRGAAILVGRCYDLAETPPYGPWVEALARAPGGDDLPALPMAVLPPERDGEVLSSQDAVIRRVQAYLAALAAKQPLVLLLEDMHWADTASLDLLRVVARNIADVPLLLLATYRADEVAPDHPLSSLPLALVREARAVRLDLPPLNEDAIGALIAVRYALGVADGDRLACYLARRTEGNPLFLAELLRTLESAGGLHQTSGRWALRDLEGVPVPTLLRQVIAGRLGRLGDEDRRLLGVAAVLGQEPSFALWATVGETEEGALLGTAERAISARALEPTEAGVRFAHALIREVLYAGVLAPRRQAWHLMAGEGLLATAHPDPDAVAYHLRQAGDPRAAEWLIRAGERARRAYAWPTAADHLEAALALLEARGAGADERGWLLVNLSRLRRSTDMGRAFACAEEAARLAAEAGDVALAAYASFQAGYLRCLTGDLRRGLVVFAAAIAAQGALTPADAARLAARRATLGDPRVAFGDDNALAVYLATVGRYAEAAALVERCPLDSPALDRAAAHAGHEALARVSAALGRTADARRHFAWAHAAYLADGRDADAGWVRLDELAQVLVPYLADDPAALEHAAAEGEEYVRRAGGLLGGKIFPSLWRLLVLAGRWTEMRALATRAESGPYRHFAQFLLALLAHAQGDAVVARALVREWHPDGPDTEPGDTTFLAAQALQCVAAQVELDAGDLPAARAWLEAHDRWLAWSGAVVGRAEGALGWAAFHRMRGDLSAAREHAECALAHAAEPRQPLALLDAHRLLGELATDDSQHDDASAHLDTALALAKACEASYARALTLLALAELHWATRHVPEAQIALAEARTTFARLGAAPALARAERLAARLALVRPQPAYPSGLTEREVAVLRLVAAGQSNGEAAASLAVSKRTVERHLENLYRKIAARNRADATAYALRHNLT